MSDATPAAAAPSIDDLRAKLVGYDLPGGGARFEPHEAWIGNDAMRAPHLPDNRLGPGWLLPLALRGVGITIAELLALAESSVDDGVVFGELTLGQALPVYSGIDYSVTGKITDIRRRSGATLGIFDILQFEMRVTSAEPVCATVGCSFILPRRSA